MLVTGKANAAPKALACVLALIVAISVLAGCSSQSKNANVILATTTSVQDSGLLDVLVPLFEQKTGYKVKTIALGSGAAIAMGEKGEADALLVHSPAAEQKLVDAKIVMTYKLLMHNDYVIVGPAKDPAAIRRVKSPSEAVKKVAAAGAGFVSRSDESGTHTKEKQLWTAAGTTPDGQWYIRAGAGMGQTLMIASEKGAYTLTDRATYLAQKKNISLDILVEGDASLLNVYHVMQVNPEKFPRVNAAGAKAFVDFMVSADTQKKIGEFKDKNGQLLFVPDAGKTVEQISGGK